PSLKKTQLKCPSCKTEVEADVPAGKGGVKCSGCNTPIPTNGAGIASDDAINTAYRSALFVKMAVKNKPPLSPAMIQATLGGLPKTLLNPKVDESVFQRLAKQAIANAASRGELAKQICTATDSEFFELTAQANALGWMVDERGGAPFPGLSDPTLLIEIVGK